MHPLYCTIYRRSAFIGVAVMLLGMLALTRSFFDDKHILHLRCVSLLASCCFTVIMSRLLLRILRLRHRIRDNQCFYCAYDLRASKDTCPECGHPILPTVACSRCHTLNLLGEPQCWKCDRTLPKQIPAPQLTMDQGPNN